ncbi:MAG: ABC transporter ATP-binding protein [Flavobacteriales bacterium]|nr:MAG: ABC transporter ATP-binding protein [Flavobacteriales bacterium]
MISLKELGHQYGNHATICFPDWEVRQGEHWLILGQSGSGKSSLLNILTGLLKPSKGEVNINGQNLYQLKENKLDKFRALNIGLVFQKPHLIGSLTVLENLKITQSLAGLKPDLNRIEEVLLQLDIAEKAKSYPKNLSAGQLQRVSIARAVLNKPKIILADEPTSSLDDINTAKVLDLLAGQAVLENASLIIATHDNRIKNKIDRTYSIGV